MTTDSRRLMGMGRLISGRVPEASFDYCLSLLTGHRLELVINRPRRTRLGDYSPPRRGRPWHRITVNENLNPYAFLTTLLHEIAHLHVALTFRGRVQPHGPEWKQAFATLLEPVVDSHGLPDDVTAALERMMDNPRASSCTDRDVLAALSRYDAHQPTGLRLDDLPEGSVFRLSSGKVFRHRQRLRTWHRCTELTTRREYRVRGSCLVQVVESDGPHGQ